MSRSVLTIGLDASLAKDLRKFFHVSSIRDAEQLLTEAEINTIILDAKITSCVLDDTMSLLASTPVTTRLILITSETDDANTYSELGIEVLDSPAGRDELLSFLKTVDQEHP
jgi:hypothetical protein